MSFTLIDLFSGAGGLATGAMRAGFDIVYANDFDQHMCNTYMANHPNTYVECNDIDKINLDSVSNIIKSGELDVISGGPPCQGFSTVGKKNEDDPRNKLFKYFFKFVDYFSPKIVVFENVQGFKGLYSGRAYNAVREKLWNLNYYTEYGVLNAAGYGVPQNRKRTIIIGYKNGFRIDLPAPTVCREDYVSVYDAISDLPENKSAEYKCSPRTRYQEARRNGVDVLTLHEISKHGENLMNIIKKVPYGGSILDVPEEMRVDSYFNNTYARLVWDEPAGTITRNFCTPSSTRCIHPKYDRALTTREGARLQSFDDDYIFRGSRTSINLQIGNAVPPLLSEAIFKNIKKGLKNNS